MTLTERPAALQTLRVAFGPMEQEPANVVGIFINPGAGACQNIPRSIASVARSAPVCPPLMIFMGRPSNSAGRTIAAQGDENARGRPKPLLSLARRCRVCVPLVQWGWQAIWVRRP